MNAPNKIPFQPHGEGSTPSSEKVSDLLARIEDQKSLHAFQYDFENCVQQELLVHAIEAMAIISCKTIMMVAEKIDIPTNDGKEMAAFVGGITNRVIFNHVQEFQAACAADDPR